MKSRRSQSCRESPQASAGEIPRARGKQRRGNAVERVSPCHTGSGKGRGRGVSARNAGAAPGQTRLVSAAHGRHLEMEGNTLSCQVKGVRP